MATKPTTLPRFADVSGDIVEPTSGKKDVGWVAGEEPPAQYFNWLLYWLYKWTEYLNDGDLQGPHTFDDNVDIDGDLDVTGTFTAAQLEGSDYVSTTEADIRHGDCTMEVPLQWPFGMIGGDYGTTVADAGLEGIADMAGNGAYISGGTNASKYFVVKLPLKSGDRLKSVRLTVFDNSGSAIRLSVWKQSMSSVVTPPGTITQLGSNQDSSNSANFQDLVVSGLTETISGPPISYMAKVELASSSHNVYALWITYDRVA